MNPERIKELKEYHAKLIEHKLNNQKEYQKIIMGLSGGALTISMTFSDKIISSQDTLFNFILIIGWLLLLFTILLQVHYNNKVTSSTNHLILKIEAVISEKEDEKEIFDIYIDKIKELDLLNKTSTIMMFLGLLFLSIFFSLNFLLKNKNSPAFTSNQNAKNINHEYPKVTPINIENNPIFINNNGKTDTTIIKKIIYRKPKLKNPCDQ
ncbi:hypothetical protein B4N84_09605 [Flavobacterium sp. IR1]|nr:hypothetical protein B4N84_09605 [Flavobacterium sp. IR1]